MRRRGGGAREERRRTARAGTPPGGGVESASEGPLEAPHSRLVSSFHHPPRTIQGRWTHTTTALTSASTVAMAAAALKRGPAHFSKARCARPSLGPALFIHLLRRGEQRACAATAKPWRRPGFHAGCHGGARPRWKLPYGVGGAWLRAVRIKELEIAFSL